MKAKILTFKPCKSGEVTLYLGTGVDLRELIDLIGQEVIIELAAGREQNTAKTELDDRLKTIMAMIQDYGDSRARTDADDILEELSKLPAEEPIDVFEFGEGK